MSKTVDYFLQYVKIDTRSEDDTGTSPSTQKQHELAKLLTAQLEAMGRRLPMTGSTAMSMHPCLLPRAVKTRLCLD